MRRLALVALLAVVMILLALAGGQDHATASPVDPDLAAAVAYWSETPSQCDSLDIQMVPDFADTRIGQATQPVGEWRGPCEMVVQEGLGVRLQCYVVVHEYGHWLGFDHSPDPSSPMYYASMSGAVVQGCEDLYWLARYERCMQMDYWPAQRTCKRRVHSEYAHA